MVGKNISRVKDCGRKEDHAEALHPNRSIENRGYTLRLEIVLFLSLSLSPSLSLLDTKMTKKMRTAIRPPQIAILTERLIFDRRCVPREILRGEEEEEETGHRNKKKNKRQHSF